LGRKTKFLAILFHGNHTLY